MRYSVLTRRYFETPPAIGPLRGPGVVTGAAGSPALGTWVRFDLQFEPPAAGASPRIAAAAFLAFGCPHTIAAAAWVAEQAIGARPSAELPRSVEAIRRLFDAPIEKLGRLLVVEDAWRAAIGAFVARK